MVIYQYVICDGKVKKVLLEAEDKDRNFYLVKDGKNQRFLEKSSLDKVYRNMVCTFTEDDAKHEKLLIDYYEERVTKARAKLEEQERILSSLKQQLVG